MIKYTLNLDISRKDLTVMSEARFAIIRNNNLDFTEPMGCEPESERPEDIAMFKATEAEVERQKKLKEAD